jgi:hypothetical protein
MVVVLVEEMNAHNSDAAVKVVLGEAKNAFMTAQL